MPERERLIGAEVGVWTGKLSSRLLAARPRLTLIMVDRWTPPGNDDSYRASGSETALLPPSEYDRAYRKTLDAVKFAGDRAVIRKMESAEAAAMSVDASLDFAFIDGDHSFDGCTRDIELWYPKVRPGGWICGHDYDHPDQGDVMQAVHTFFQKVEVDVNRTWFFRK